MTNPISGYRARVLGTAAGVLALTAFAGEHAAEQIREAGFDAYLAKPIEARKLIAAVAKLAAHAG